MVTGSGVERERSALTRQAILAAAQGEFAAVGFRRTAMVDVARRAGVSRATLYQHWNSKESLFRAAIQALHDDHLAALREIVVTERPVGIEDRLVAALEARLLAFVRLTAGSPHAAELYESADRVAGDISTSAFAASDKQLTSLLQAAAKRGEIDLAASGLSAAQAVKVLVHCAHGAKGEDPSALTEAAFRRSLRRAVRLLVVGLAPS